MRLGIISRKIGMTRLFSEKGEHIPVTVLKIDDCHIVEQKTQDKHGYQALVLATGDIKTKNVNKSLRGFFAKVKIEPRRYLKEFHVETLQEVGTILKANHFNEGQYVDVIGNSIGKGFQGVMKRHNFGGLPASHGVSVTHRSHGSTGNRQDPGRVFKGKKMAGHMGTNRVTTQNLLVVRTDIDRGLIFLKGAVPGSKGSVIYIRDAIKKGMPAIE